MAENDYADDPFHGVEGAPLDELDGWAAAEPAAPLDPEVRIVNDPFYVPPVMLWPRSLNEDRQKAIAYTVWFVEWLLAVWRLDKKLIPPCWVKHPDIVHEMWALGLSYYDSHTQPNNGGPAQWLLYLDYQKRRLAENSAAEACAGSGSHELFGSEPKDVDERRTTYGEGDAEHPELPVAITPWTWPHTHPDPAGTPDWSTTEKNEES